MYCTYIIDHRLTDVIMISYQNFSEEKSSFNKTVQPMRLTTTSEARNRLPPKTELTDLCTSLQRIQHPSALGRTELIDDLDGWLLLVPLFNVQIVICVEIRGPKQNESLKMSWCFILLLWCILDLPLCWRIVVSFCAAGLAFLWCNHMKCYEAYPLQ